METINYYSESVVGLEHIEAIAKSLNYRTSYETFSESYRVLFVYNGDDPHMRWEWSVYEADDLGIEPEVIAKIKALHPATILLMNYDPYWLSEAAAFLRLVLQQYDGLIDCKGDADVIYRLDNIEDIVGGCP